MKAKYEIEVGGEVLFSKPNRNGAELMFSWYAHQAKKPESEHFQKSVRIVERKGGVITAQRTA